MKFITLNTKTNEVKAFEDYEIENEFGCDSFYDHYGFLENEEEKQSYYTDMIEYTTWTSPKGVMPIYKVNEVIA